MEDVTDTGKLSSRELEKGLQCTLQVTENNNLLIVKGNLVIMSVAPRMARNSAVKTEEKIVTIPEETSSSETAACSMPFLCFQSSVKMNWAGE